MRLPSRGNKHSVKKSADRKARSADQRHQSGERNERLSDFCLATSTVFQVVFITRSNLTHMQSLFVFPIVWAINLLLFFDGKKDAAAVHLVGCFRFFDPVVEC